MKRFSNAVIAGFVGLWISPVFAQQQPLAVEGEYIVKFRAAAGLSSARQKLSNRVTMKAAYPNEGIYHIKSRDGGAADLHALETDPDVEYVEPNYILRKSDVKPQTYQEALASGVSSNPSAYSQSNGNTRIADAWRAVTPLENNRRKTVVAVVDSGLDVSHPLYQKVGQGGGGALWINEMEANGLPGVDDDGNGYVDDISGWNFIKNNSNFADDDSHGSHVAGIVAGAGQNIFARPLQESKILVMPLKFLDENGSGTTANAIKAIYYAVENGAKIINNSWGGSSYSRSLHDALTYAYNRRVLIVSAAGNYASNNDSYPMYPANYDVPSNIAVASVSSYDSRSGFSNYGRVKVTVSAPGEYIESTVLGGYTSKMSGTSMAAPFIAGVAALAAREAPSLSGYQIKELVLDSADPVARLQEFVNGSRRVNAERLVTSAQGYVGVMATQPSYEPTYLRDLASSPEMVGGGGCGLVKSITKDGPGSGKGSGGGAGVVLALLLLPVIAWHILRSQAKSADPANKRRFDRFKMSSEVRVSVGDKELVGTVNTISQGGLSFNVDEALERGGIITMRIQSPDGHEMIEVQGQVVWSEANQAYGVQFANAKQGTLAMIRDWTSGLIKS